MPYEKMITQMLENTEPQRTKMYLTFVNEDDRSNISISMFISYFIFSIHFLH